MTRRRRSVLAFAFLAAGAFASSLSLAQSNAPPSQRHHHPRAKRPADGGPVQPQPEPTAPRDRGTGGDVHALDAGAVESKTLDGGARVFRFGEVDIEGHLRNPQLVYFLRRVRAEFGAGDLGHRSFMRELSDTRHNPSF